MQDRVRNKNEEHLNQRLNMQKAYINTEQEEDNAKKLFTSKDNKNHENDDGRLFPSAVDEDKRGMGDKQSDDNLEKTDDTQSLELDARAIHMRIKEAIKYMESTDRRNKGSGFFSAMANNMRAEEFGGSYYRCEPQSELVIDWLHDLDLSNKWEFYIVEDHVPFTEQPHHYWVEAVDETSKNIIRFDPLYNKFSYGDKPSPQNRIMRTAPTYDFTGITDSKRYTESSQKLRKRQVDQWGRMVFEPISYK